MCVQIEEWFEGNKMENDHTANMRKILARGGTVRAALLNLNKRQKRVERVEVLVAEDYAHRRVAEVVVAAERAACEEKRKTRDEVGPLCSRYQCTGERSYEGPHVWR